MATSDTDQKILCGIAKLTSVSDPILSSSLYQVLGLSVLLSRKLYRARKLRRLDVTRDTKSLSLYHHILWLSREGLTIVEAYVLPRTREGQQGHECLVFGAKLRASFYHVFCLFHNNPPISQLGNLAATSPSAGNIVASETSGDFSTASQADNEQSAPSSAERKGKAAALRDPVPSMTSEASYVTNPYALGGPVRSPPIPGLTSPPLDLAIGLPPGLAPLLPNMPSSERETSSSYFLLPRLNFVPITQSHFTTAATLANDLLPGTHPLRLSVALEYAAFLWDCARDERACRRVAREAIRGVYTDDRTLSNGEFDEAASLVAGLGAWQRRRESTERTRVEGKRKSADTEKMVSGHGLERLKAQEREARQIGDPPGTHEEAMIRDRREEAAPSRWEQTVGREGATEENPAKRTRTAREPDEQSRSAVPAASSTETRGQASGSRVAGGEASVESSDQPAKRPPPRRATDSKSGNAGTTDQGTATIRSADGKTRTEGSREVTPKTSAGNGHGARSMPGAYF